MNVLARGLFLVGVLILCSLSNAHAMRCNGQIVDTGDSISKVVSACGSPTSSSGDFWGDKGVMVYNLSDGSVWTLQTLNGVVSNVDMGR